jgi:hypothetical protein
VANCNCCRATASLTSGVVAVAATGPSCPHPCFLSDYYVFSTALSSIKEKQFPTLLAFKVEIKHSILWIDQKILSVATSVDCVVLNMKKLFFTQLLASFLNILNSICSH